MRNLVTIKDRVIDGQLKYNINTFLLVLFLACAYKQVVRREDLGVCGVHANNHPHTAEHICILMVLKTVLQLFLLPYKGINFSGF